MLLVSGFFLTAGLWFIFSSGYWDIKTVEIGELKTLERGEVLRELDQSLNDRGWRPWHVHNLLMMDEKKISNQLRDRLFIEQIAVEKVYPNILRLKIVERQRSVVLVSDNQFFIVDTTGVITSIAEDDVVSSTRARLNLRAITDNAHLPIIVMKTADPVAPGFEIAKSDQVKRWLEASHKIVLEGLQFCFMDIDSPESNLARFKAPKNYNIYIDLSRSLEVQIAAYKDFIKSKSNEDSIKEYIDVRIPGRVFVK